MGRRYPQAFIPHGHFALLIRRADFVRDRMSSPTEASSKPLSMFVFHTYPEASRYAREVLGRCRLGDAIIVPTEAIRELSINWTSGPSGYADSDAGGES